MCADNYIERLLLWKTCERPLDWERRFGRSAPLEVEIGFGGGDWLVSSARKRPAHDFVGIDAQWPSVKRGLRKLRTGDVQNVRLIMTDAQVALQRLFRPRSIQRISSLFPCPWPKKRHIKHRLFSRRFLTLANSRLEDHGDLLIVTDSEAFADWTQDQGTDTGLICTRTPIPPSYQTKYERKWQAMGQHSFHELVFRKERHADLPLTEDHELQSHHIPRFDPECFRPQTLDEKDLHVGFKETLYDPLRQKAMVQVVVVERDMQQNFWIEIELLEDTWRVQPARGCGIIPTAGVQRALDLVRDGTSEGTSKVT